MLSDQSKKENFIRAYKNLCKEYSMFVNNEGYDAGFVQSFKENNHELFINNTINNHIGELTEGLISFFQPPKKFTKKEKLLLEQQKKENKKKAEEEYKKFIKQMVGWGIKVYTNTKRIVLQKKMTMHILYSRIMDIWDNTTMMDEATPIRAIDLYTYVTVDGWKITTGSLQYITDLNDSSEIRITLTQ